MNNPQLSIKVQHCFIIFFAKTICILKFIHLTDNRLTILIILTLFLLTVPLCKHTQINNRHLSIII